MVFRLSYTGPSLEGSHQSSSGKQQGASFVSRLTEGLFVALRSGFSVAVSILGSPFNGLLACLEMIQTQFFEIDRDQKNHSPE